MRLLVILALANVALGGHVAVRMPFLNPAGVTYTQYGQAPHGGHQHVTYSEPHAQYAYQQGYDGHQQGYDGHQQGYDGHQQVTYSEPHAQYAYQQEHVHYAQQPAAIGYAQVPVKTAVAVPTVHHVPAVADVPYTKIEAQPAVFQKIVDVAKPAIKTRKFEIRRPAIQKQFYDIEEHTIIRPVGSALVELDEPLSKAQKGPALVQSLEDPHHVAVAAEHHAPIAIQHHAQVPVQYHAPIATNTIAITPTPHSIAVTSGHAHHYHQSEPYVSVTPKLAVVDTPYLHKQIHHEQVVVSSTPAPIHYSSEPYLVSSTPIPHLAEVAAQNAAIEHAAKNAALEHAAYNAHVAHEEAAHAHYNHANAHLGVESYSNGAPHEQIVQLQHHEIAPEHHVRQLNHLSHEEAQDNQQKLLKLLTARGGVAEIGFGRPGHAEHVGDAGISRARVLSATPSPLHPPVEEKVKTRRIVVSRPVQTLQEIDVVEPATKIERVAINQHAVIKTAKVGVERVHTSVPVYGKTLAPAIAHAQVPVSYYHK